MMLQPHEGRKNRSYVMGVSFLLARQEDAQRVSLAFPSSFPRVVHRFLNEHLHRTRTE